MEDEEKKVNPKAIALVVAFVLALSVCGAYFISRWKSEQKTKQLMNNVNSSDESQEKLGYTNMVVSAKTAENQWDELPYYNSDFSSVKDYEDVVGWVYYPLAEIDYPVVQGGDNKKYLTTSIDGTYSINGWIFADYRADMQGMSSQNTVIYGHDMLSGTMFGQLDKVLEKDTFKDDANKYIYFNSMTNRYVYKIFAVYVSDLSFNFIQTVFTDNEFANYIQHVQELTNAQGVDLEKTVVYPKDKILTLCTCAEGGKKRLVVSAIRCQVEKDG